jgi:CDP-glucose 4,6-dehydratase
MGTANLLEAIRKTPSVRAAVMVTTDKCYQNKEWVWPYREIDPLGGYDPYSSSKACAEIICATYRDSFFRVDQDQVALATARVGNVIGGGDWSPDRLVPDLI